MSEEKNFIGYCFKCKEKREIIGPKAEWSANGSPGTRGVCSVCAGTIYKTGYTAAHEHLPKPEITAKKRKKKSAKKQTRRGKLVIVESPAKARTIGRYLGRGYTVKSSVGHVRDLLKSRLSVDVDNGFMPEYRVPNDKRKLVKELKEAAAKAKEIYLATDPDREGEAIAWHVLESAEMELARTKRVVFHEITKPAIEKAFETPREIDMPRVDAQQARRILDRLVGYKLSPLLWRKVRGRLSAGRVQSVAVRLVVERERAIDAFDSVEYWTVGAQLSQEKFQDVAKRPSFSAKLSKINGKDPVLNSEADVLPHLDALEKSSWTIGKVRVGKRTRRPAAPFTTSTLQQEASRKLNFRANKTMRLAQQLYEGIELGGSDGTVGLITYMRTDSVTVSKTAQDEARGYVSDRFGANFIPDKPPVYKTRAKSAQEAHEAVRPTSALRTPKQMKENLSRDQYRLYKLIWDRFVASQMSPAIYDTVSAEVWAGEADVAVNKRPYLFRASGSTLRFSGFLALYEETRPEDKPDDGSNQVPSDLQTNEIIDLLKLLPEQHFTQPPPRFSEATLVKTLEENGIGRPSTYAAIMSTIQNRGYVDREDKRLVPTETGLLVNDLLVEYFPNVLSVDFTARLEGELDTIAEGKPWVPVISAFYGNFSERLQVADEALPKLDLKKEPELVGRACPLCENPLVYREGRYGRFVGCSTFPKCRHTEQILNKTGVSCANGGEIIERKTKRGRTFYGCSRYPDCEWRSWQKPVPDTANACDGVVVQKNGQQTECVACGLKEKSPEQEAVKA
ncbi:MAG: type I DNA topoisomerase [Chloroflexi bacterium]|nr:type I DNA topoisomerase [Chloroflexota bacterium]